MAGSKNLNDILSSINNFGNKCGIGYNEGISMSSTVDPKLDKLAIEDPKKKSVVTIQKGKLIVSF